MLTDAPMAEGERHNEGLEALMLELEPFGDRFLTIANDYASRPALRYHGEVMSYEELLREVLTVSKALRQRGLKRGDRVLLACAEKLPMFLCHLGVMMAGGMSVPLNPDFTVHELAYFVTDADPRLAVADGAAAGLLGAVIAEREASCEVVSAQELAGFEGGPLESPCFAADDDCLMLYSSGTTGEPKGAVHTHGSLAHAVAAIAKCWQFTPDDTLLNCLPLYHIHGLSFASHTVLSSGCEMMLEDRFHPRDTMEQMKDATVFYGIPPFHYAFMKRPEFPDYARQWEKLRLITCGSAPIRPEVLPELEAIVGQPIINRYGMTETHVITSLPLTGPHKQGSVGLPLPGIEVQVRNKDGAAADVGEVGGVYVRGPNLFDRYWRMKEGMARTFDEGGWFETGDLAESDEDGFLTMRGRSKDLIIVSGYNVYPPIVERVLNSCPLVQESAVIGVPDERRGERVVAVVVCDDCEPDEAAIKSYARQYLVEYQCPDRVVFLAELPRNTMGKILKRQLRDELA
jgi:malonyl-CoA/methylmalonyl-CoA synthetase